MESIKKGNKEQPLASQIVEDSNEFFYREVNSIEELRELMNKFALFQATGEGDIP